MPFYGVTDGKTLPMGQIELPVMFGERNNFCAKNAIFNMARLNLPYNAILGRPALANFMSAVHYAYSTQKILGPSGVISIKADVKGSVCYAEKLYEDMTTVSQDDGECLSCWHTLQQSSESHPTRWPSPRQFVSRTIPRRWP
jgi:hypothetical protein